MENESEKNSEIQFPFEPNKKVKAAFREDIKLQIAIDSILESLIKKATKIDKGFNVLFREHPELISERGNLKYNRVTEKIERDC